MAWYIGVGPKGMSRARYQKIEDCLRPIKTRLSALPKGAMVELAYKAEARYRPDFTLGRDMDTELAKLGVLAVWRDGEDNSGVYIVNGISHSLKRIETTAKEIKALPEDKRLKAVLHVIQTLYFSGIPVDSLRDLGNRTNMDVKVTATGLGAARGVAGTGNFGALALIMYLGRDLEAKIGVLNGGVGSRLGGMESLKGDIVMGRTNLTIWNLITGEYFRQQMPKGKDSEGKDLDWGVWLANDGMLIPFGCLTSEGKLLSEIPGKEAKDGYFLFDPIPDTVSDQELSRFGVAAVMSDVGFATSTEKPKGGRREVAENAQKELLAQGKPFDPEKMRPYINYYGMITSPRLEKDLRNVLRSLVKEGLIADTVGDLDTYSLLFAAASSSKPEEFRKKIGKSGLMSMFAEPQFDKIVHKRLREVLFKDGKLRFGFAEFNRGSRVVDVGTFASLFGFYLGLSQNYEADGEARQKLFDLRRNLMDKGYLSPAETAVLDEIEAITRNTERVIRMITHKVAGYDANHVVEDCEFTLCANEEDAPILGVPTDYYSLDQATLSRLPDGVDANDVNQLLRLPAGVRAQLIDYRDGAGRLLFRYHPEGIKTLCLKDCKIYPRTIIGRNTTVIDAEIGDGETVVILAEGGATVKSKVVAPITHKQVDAVTDRRKVLDELDKNLRRMAAQGTGEYSVIMPDGWKLVITHETNQRMQGFLKQVDQITAARTKDEKRDLGRLPLLDRLLGREDLGQRLVKFDTNSGIGNLQLVGADALSLTCADPSAVHYFSVRYERVPRPRYIVYGTKVSSPIVVDKDTAYSQKKVKGLGPAKPYALSFTFDPNSERLNILPGGVSMKDDPREGFVYFKNAELRTNAELLDLKDKAGNAIIPQEMAQAVEDLLQLIPAAAEMPEGKFKPVSINKTELAKIIEAALRENKDVSEVIMQELYAQTPHILSQYIAPITGKAIDEIETALAGNCEVESRGKRHPFEGKGKDKDKGLFKWLAVTDAKQQRQIAAIIKGYPLSEAIFTEYGLTYRGFLPVLEAMLEQFRLKEVPIAALPDKKNSTSVSLQALFPGEQVMPELPPATPIFNIP